MCILALSLAGNALYDNILSIKKTSMMMCLAAEHYSDDLGMELEDSMEQDFNMKLEDGSPYEVR